ncbi:Fibronectin type III domain protein [compost metagenome]
MISHCKDLSRNAIRCSVISKNNLSLVMLLICSFVFSQDFVENFDSPGVTAPSGSVWVLPDTGTWHVFDNGIGAQQDWTLNTEGTFPAYSQPRAAYINRESIGQSNTSHDYLATPLINFPVNPQLRFKTRTTLQPLNGTIFEIRAASASSDPALPGSYTTLIATWTETDLTENYDVYEEKVVNLTLPEPSMYIAFVKVTTQIGTAISGDRWLIDDVIITGECLNAENVTAIPSTTSAVLSWDSFGPASQWYVHVLPAGIPLTDPTVGVPVLTSTPNANEGFTVTSTTQSIPTTILSGTEYVFWVQSVCEFETSEWISSAVYTTEPLSAICGGNYIDDGGIDGNYLPDNNTVTTICPGPGEIVTVTFSSFDIESGFDGIYVYDGDSVNAPQIMSENGVGYGGMVVPGAFWGNQIPGPFISTNANGCLTFKFISSGSINNPGFVANITCSPAPECQKPTFVSINPVTTQNSITVSWTPVGVASQWLVYAIPCDSPIPVAGTPGGILTGDTTLTINNLTPATCYDVIIFSVCDGIAYSEPTLPQTIATLVPAPVCGGMFMDPAGPLDYEMNTDYTVTICPDAPDSVVSVEFLEFAIQENFDGLYIYDGDSTNAPQFNSGNTGGWLPNILEPGAYWGTQIPGPFTATSENGCLTFHFMSNQAFNNSGWLANVICQPAPLCPQPTALIAGLPLPTKATVSWTNVGPATSWEVIAVLCGSPIPTPDAIGLPASESPFQYSGLTPDTCYEFYVRANCSSTDNGVSTWAGPVALTTEPAPPVCGEIFTDEGGDANYPEISSSVVTICPENVGDIVTVIFTSFMVHEEDDALYVYDGATTAAPQIASTNGPGNWQYPNVQLPGGFWGTELPGPFEATNPDGCLTFEFKSNNTNAWAPSSMPGWEASVVCSPAPNCSKPIDVIITGITQTSVTVDWTEVGTATNWHVLVLPYSDPFPNPESAGWQSTAIKPFTYEPLIPGLRYKVYVRAACSDDDTSSWSYYKEFHTPISNDFCEGAIEVPVNPDANCGQIQSGTLFGAGSSGQSSGTMYPCIGNDNVDVWFKFTAIESKHYITMNRIDAQGLATSYSPPFSLFSGDCQGGLTYMACYSGPTNATFSHIVADALIPGETYYIQVFGSQASTDNFKICIGTTPPAIRTSEEFTTEQLIHDVLFDSTCAIINNVTSSTGTNFGSVNGIGYFNKNQSDFPFKEGVILSTGYISNAVGPNNTYLADGLLPSEGVMPLWTGDTDLEAIILEGTGTPLYSVNATKLEFDFVPVIPFINFNFIFASDEYGYYQCNFSDSFAFILTDLSEPGAAPVNLAVLPSTNIPISVVTIRDTAFNSECASVNQEYFGKYYGEYFNDDGPFLPDGKPAMSAPINFRGMTVPLTAYSEVIPGHQYHIKLVIADRGDYAMDSAVFIEAGSFDIGNIDLGSDFLISDGTAICGDLYTIDTGLPATSYSFIWKKNDEVLTGETGPSLQVAVNGSYSVTALYNNSECFTTDTVIVEFYSPGILSPIEAITKCTSFTLPVPPVGHYYAQQGGQGVILDETTISSIGEHIIYQYYSSGPQCNEEVSFILTITESLELEEIDDIISCGTYSLPGLPGASYYNGPGATAGAITSVSSTQKVYAYIAGDTPECSAEQNFTVFITDLPQLEISGQCNGNEYILEVKVLNLIPEITYSYAWTNQGGEIVSATNTQAIIVSGKGEYSVVVTNDDCEGYAEKLVTATSCMIQRGISPNGDDLNEVFDLEGFGVKKLQIFNRYGRIVYERSPYSKEWNGLSDNGQELPDGTYFYVINFEGEKETKTGWIYLIR